MLPHLQGMDPLVPPHRGVELRNVGIGEGGWGWVMSPLFSRTLSTHLSHPSGGEASLQFWVLLHPLHPTEQADTGHLPLWALI